MSSDVPDKKTSSAVVSESSLVPNMSDGFATGAGAAGFETNDKTYAPTPGAQGHGGTDAVNTSLEGKQQGNISDNNQKSS